MSCAEHSYLSLDSTGLHRVVYSAWGEDLPGRPVICVHGLTGNGNDFDYLAPHLTAQGRPVYAVDLPGRGRSDFLRDPLDYNYTQYCHDLLGLIARLGEKAAHGVDWVGVSLGGLLGIRLAGLRGSPIRRLILNDIGPVVPRPVLDFIHKVISQDYAFDSILDLEARMRATRGLTWGPVTDEQWRHMAEHNARALDDGRITYAYDPAIAKVFEHNPIGDADLWPFWDAINIPALVIRGAQSVLLTPDILTEMMARGPGVSGLAGTVTFEGCGHVPSLMAPDQITVITQWLETTAS